MSNKDSIVHFQMKPVFYELLQYIVFVNGEGGALLTRLVLSLGAKKGLRYVVT